MTDDVQSVEYVTPGIFGEPIGRRTMWLVVVLRCPAPKCGAVHHHRASSLLDSSSAVIRHCPTTGHEYVVTPASVPARPAAGRK